MSLPISSGAPNTHGGEPPVMKAQKTERSEIACESISAWDAEPDFPQESFTIPEDFPQPSQNTLYEYTYEDTLQLAHQRKIKIDQCFEILSNLRIDNKKIFNRNLQQSTAEAILGNEKQPGNFLLRPSRITGNITVTYVDENLVFIHLRLPIFAEGDQVKIGTPSSPESIAQFIEKMHLNPIDLTNVNEANIHDAFCAILRNQNLQTAQKLCNQIENFPGFAADINRTHAEEKVSRCVIRSFLVRNIHQQPEDENTFRTYIITRKNDSGKAEHVRLSVLKCGLIKYGANELYHRFIQTPYRQGPVVDFISVKQQANILGPLAHISPSIAPRYTTL